MEVLCELAQYCGEVVTRDDLISRLWGVEFGADESLTRAISLLRKTFRTAGPKNGFIETIRKRGYRLTEMVTIVGAAPVLIQYTTKTTPSSVPTPDIHSKSDDNAGPLAEPVPGPTSQLQHTPQLSISAPPPIPEMPPYMAAPYHVQPGPEFFARVAAPKPRKRVIFAWFAPVTLAIIAALSINYSKIFVPAMDLAKINAPEPEDNFGTLLPTTRPNGRSVAVLPFADMSAAKDQAYLTDGMAEELLNELAQIPDLRVVGRSTASAAKNANLDIAEIGRRLRVSHIIEGAIRKQGNQVRISAQLINTEDSLHIWSETYNGTLDNVFELEERIAKDIASELKINLSVGIEQIIELDLDDFEHALSESSAGSDAEDSLEKRTGLTRKEIRYRLFDRCQSLRPIMGWMDPEYLRLRDICERAGIGPPGGFERTDEHLSPDGNIFPGDDNFHQPF